MTIVKVGKKGQITLKKEWREELGIEPGSLVEEIPTKEGILVKPKKSVLKEWKKLSGQISEKWPKGKTAVDIIREERR